MALTDCVRSGDLSSVVKRLDAGADVDQPDGDGLTPLMIAAGYGHGRLVETLLRAGANVLAAEPRMGATALHKAAQSGDADVIAVLLDHGAFIDQQTPTLGHIALIDAVLHKQEAAVDRLLARGARAALKTHYNSTALDLAQADGLERICLLIEAQAQAIASEAGSQRLMAAIRVGDVDRVRRLIAEGASLDERVPMLGSLDDDYTPLGLAARDGHADIVRVLLEGGADLRAVNGLMGATAGHEAGYMGRAHVARTLVQHRAGGVGLDLDAQGAYNGYTALHDAVWRGHLDVAAVLVEAGARLDLKTHAGLTARELAVRLGYDELAGLLLEAERGGSAGVVGDAARA